MDSITITTSGSTIPELCVNFTHNAAEFCQVECGQLRRTELDGNIVTIAPVYRREDTGEIYVEFVAEIHTTRFGNTLSFYTNESLIFPLENIPSTLLITLVNLEG